MDLQYTVTIYMTIFALIMKKLFWIIKTAVTRILVSVAAMFVRIKSRFSMY